MEKQPKPQNIRKVLIANRGEIAVRIAQTLQVMGIGAVAVYSEPDGQAPHVMAADEAYPLGGKTPGESYLRIEKIIDIARQAQVDAIHPGYGFLSENAVFAEVCREAGLTFIGPRPETIRAMGDKIVSKQLMIQAGVPVVPGCELSTEGDLSPETIVRYREEAERVGYPVLVKAAAGGGGKGMRLVHRPEELLPAVEAAVREATGAFGDGRVFLEKYINAPRHIEFQIFGDHHGQAVHLFERECSIQRRHQKILEESPSPALTTVLREEMGQAAVKAAQALGYTNAGTVEFILDEAGRFYFLEVNTRLQVEHPVTEMTIHRDLVRTQIQVACGEPLPFTPDTLRQSGHAIECRIYAEDPSNRFLPSTGVLQRYLPPSGPGVRVDSGVREGSEISVHYDPMLAKLIVWGDSRTEAIERMQWALSNFVILGVKTNLEFLQRLMLHPEFQKGLIDTHFLDTHRGYFETTTPMPEEALVAAALSVGLKPKGLNGLSGTPKGDRAPYGDSYSPWVVSGSWRGV